MSSPPRKPPPRWVMTLAFLAIVAVTLWSQSRNPPQPPAEQPALPAPDVVIEPREPVPETAPSVDALNPPTRSAVEPLPAGTEFALVVKQVTIKDQSGRVVYRGDVDLAPTLDRIERGERHSHRNDGGTFRNLEGRLPKKPSGYYKEYVHPTEGLGGPGPQRVVLGRDGEVYYTADHYQTFKRLR